MSHTKFIDQLAFLDPGSVRGFGEFVQSPFHNTNQKIRQLFAYIEEHLAAIKTSELNKKDAFKAMYPKEKFDDSRLRAMLSMLSKLLEDYLVFRQMNRENPDYSLMLMDSFQQLGMEKYYSIQLQRMYKQQEQAHYRDIHYFFQQHQLEERNYNFAVSKKDPAIGKSLEHLVHHLDIYYIASRLKFSCEMLNRKNILGEKFDIQFLQILLEHINGNQLSEIPVIGIYMQIVRTFLEPQEESHFNELLRLLEKYSAQFPPAENKVMYGYAMNYCIRKINIGKEDYQEKLFRLYELLIQHESIYEGNFISQWDYKNIVTVALRLNKIDWTENFINNFKERLHPGVRGNAFKYNLASLNYFKKKFDKTLLLLREVEFTDLSYELSSKTLLLKSYYELNEYHALSNHADTFKLFLRRNRKISEYQKTIYKNLIRYITKLSKLKSVRKRLSKKLVTEIEASKDIADKTWLLGKMQEFKQQAYY